MGRKVTRAAGGLVWRDTLQGKRIAVIHSTRNGGQWILPKCKLNNSESWQHAALREVKEELGCKPRFENFAGSVSYTVDGDPMIVLFWNMTIKDECVFKKSEEVDKLIWLSEKEAFEKLYYPGEKYIVKFGKLVSKKKPSLLSRYKRGITSSERLASSLGPYNFELEHLLEKCKKENKPIWWWDISSNLLNNARVSFEKCEMEKSWRYFNLAQLMTIYSLDENGLEMWAKATLNEVEKKEFPSWRKETIIDILTEKGELKPLLNADEVYYACRLKQEHFDNTHHRIRNVQIQLNLLSVIAVLAIFTWLTFFGKYLISNKVCIYDTKIICSVILFGILGGSFSGMISIVKGSTEALTPEHIFTSFSTLSRPLIGAVSALALFVFLLSELLQVGDVITPGLVLALSFAAGFSERLVLRVIESV